MRVNFGNIGNVGGKTVVTGSASGLDTKSIIDATVTAKEIPINKLKDTVDLDNKKITAFNQFTTLLKSFRDAANSLRNPPQFDKSDDVFSLKQVSLTSNTSVSANSYIGIAASNLASVNNYKISDLTLATAKNQFANGFATNNTSVTTVIATAGMFKAGTFKINNTDIAINDGDSLVNIQSKINSVSNETDVTANIIQISSNNFQLVLESNNQGSDNAYVITDAQGCLSNISWTVNNATDTGFKFNNIPMTRSSNTIEDIVQGVTFNLYQDMPPGTIANVSIAHNPASAEQAIKAFVGCYNDIKTFYAHQNYRDPITNKFKEEAILGGDLLLSNLCKSIENELMQIVKGITSTANNPHPTNLAEIGISFYDIDGDNENPDIKNVLRVDDIKLATTLSTQFNDVKNIFQFNAYSSNSNFFITETSINLNTNKFSIDLNTARPVGEQAKLKYIDPVTSDPVTINVVYKLNSPNGTSGIISVPQGSAMIEGTRNAIHSPLDGLSIVYVGSVSATTTNITLTQGIADRIYNFAKTTIDPETGLVKDAIDNFKTDIENKNTKITRLNEQLNESKDKMLKQFADVEKAIAEANSILQMIEANDYAKREK
ncbi:MAG: flagellar filament capping protein FliD [Alphaproteobacteria bacterium]